MNKLASDSMKFGNRMLWVGKLQLFWFAVVFRYFLVAGIFPATAAVLHHFFRFFDNKEEAEPISYASFSIAAKENFKRANQVGYLSFLVLGTFYVDLRITFVIAKNVYVTVCLGALIAIFLGVNLYLIPTIVRYELSLWNAYRQAFFLLLANLGNSLAMVIGMAIAVLLSIFIPVLIIIPVPLFLLPIAWFSYQSMQKIEKANTEK